MSAYCDGTPPHGTTPARRATPAHDSIPPAADPSLDDSSIRHAYPVAGRSLLGLFALVLAAVLSGSFPPLASADPGPGSFDADAAQSYVADYATRNGLPGVAYVVVKDGHTVTSGAAGDVSATTPMSIGSVSKSFTAFAVLQLVDAGEVEMDAPITRYLPHFSVHGADPAAITVRMLLDHTSGLPNPLLVSPTGTLAGDVGGIARQTVSSRPGTAFLYSNLNYWTLALLVQEASGQDFDDYLHEHVFSPLGMHDTTSVISASDGRGLDAGHVTAYGLSVRLPETARTIGGSGGVISTARDMGRWLAMQQRGGLAADGTRLLSADLIKTSQEAQPHAGTYGLGWQHTSTSAPARVGHDGEMTRYSARVDLVPSTGYATAVLLDSFTPTISHPFTISTGLIDLADGRSPRIGIPKATAIDLALAAVSLLVLALGVRGVQRSRIWAERRRAHPRWRRVLRLLPQAVMPAVATFLLVGLTAGPGNPATPLDALGLWPAAMLLVLVAAAVGLALIVTRVVAFVRPHVSERPGPRGN